MPAYKFKSRLSWLRNGSFALADQGLLGGAGFAMAILLGRWLAPEQYGAYALAFSIFLFISGFHNALLLEPMSVLGPGSYRSELRNYLSTVIWMHFALTMIVSLVLALFGVAFKFLRPDSVLPAALLGVSIGMPTTLLYWLLRRTAYMEFRPALAIRGSVIYALSLVALLFLFRHLQWLTPLTAFVLQAFSSCLASAFVLVPVWGRFSALPRRDLFHRVLQEHWNYGRWVVGTAFVYWCAGGAYYVIVGALLRMDDVGALRSLQNFALPFSQFLAAIGLWLLPQASASFTGQGSALFHRKTRMMAFFFGAGGTVYMACLLLFGGWVFPLVYAGRYAEYLYLLPLVAFSIPFLAIAEGLSISLRAMRASSDVLIGYAVSGAITVFVGLLLTYFWGLAGALLSMLISALAFMLVMAYLFAKRLKKARPVEAVEHGSLLSEHVRVAWLMPSLDRGYYFQPVFKEFTKLFPNTLILTGFWPGFLPGLAGTFRVRHLNGLKFVTLRKNATGYETGLTLPPFSALRELVQFRPDIMFTGGFNAWTLCAFLWKLIYPSRVVLLWDGISPATAFLNSPIRLKTRRVMARFFDAAISNTNEGVDYLRTVLAMSECKLRRHPYEVPDLQMFESPVNGNASLNSLARPRFLYVGQLIRRKGVHYFLQACSILRRQGFASFSITIVGEGEEGSELRRCAHLLGLDDQVHWAGDVRYEKLAAYYRAADVFVFPTLEDIWGMVPLEAMVSGKPILCSKHAGAKEMMLHGQNGFVFDPHNPQELAQFMAKFIQQPDLIPMFSAKSKQIIASYTPHLAANVLAETISSILNSKS